MQFPEIFDAGQLGDVACGGELNLNTYTVRASQTDDLLHYQALIAHESGHWARWHGTTLGAALTLMRYAGQRLVLDGVSQLDSSERKHLRNIRKSGSAIFTLENPPAVGGEEFGILWQMWTDLHVAYSIMYDWRRIQSISWDMQEAVASALTDVQYWTYPLHGISRVPGRVKLSRSSVDLHEADGVVLNSRVLFEAIGLADELISWYRPKKGPAETTITRYMHAMESSYGSPAKILNHFLGTTGSFTMEGAMTASFLADFALNPPIPPRVLIARDSTPSWEDIYPPSRYVRCCEAINSIGLLSAEPTDEELIDYSAQVSLQTGMQNPRSYSRPDPESGAVDNNEQTAFLFRNPNVGSLDHEVIEGDYVSYLTWVQDKMWTHRLDRPTMFHHYGQAVLPKENIDRVEFLFGEKGAGWYFPQFMWSESGTIGFSSDLHQDTATQYFASMAFYLSLHHFSCAKGKFSLRNILPVEGFDPIMSDIRSAISELLGKAFWS